MGHDDDILMYSSSAVVLVLNLVVLKKRMVTGAVCLVIQIIYTAYFVHGLYFDSGGGTALAWWFYLIMINCLHFVVDVAILVREYARSKKHKS